ncbi:MAG: chromate efflux transporter [Paracoccaceae bacterium]
MADVPVKSYGELTRVFARIGVLSFGGPAAQIAVMHKELVEDRPWLSEEAFLRALSFCMLLPGPEAMQLATYAGWKLRGVWAGLLAGLLFVVPGALVIAVLVAIYASYGQVPGVQAAFLGVKASVIAIVIQALLRLSGKTLKHRSDWVLAAVAFVAIYALQLPFPVIVFIAGLWGFFTAERSTTAPHKSSDRTIVGSLRMIAIWLPLWLLPLVGLSLAGFTFLADLGWFFAKLAVVTFGGAYAVLAYMSQTVVQDYGWISAGQMIDALGLAETTPGPLILVTQFVAMLAGSIQGGIGLAILAGLTALWATFVPCFLWIFAFAPHLERITTHARLAGALKAITASVVGVILNLSVWFTINVLFQKTQTVAFGPAQVTAPVWNTLEPIALCLTVIAALAILAFKIRMEAVLFLSAIAGYGTLLL